MSQVINSTEINIEQLCLLVHLALDAASRGSSGAACQFSMNFSDVLKENKLGEIIDDVFIPNSK